MLKDFTDKADFLFYNKPVGQVVQFPDLFRHFNLIASGKQETKKMISLENSPLFQV